MSKRLIRKLRHLPVVRAVERSMKFGESLAAWADDTAERADGRAEGLRKRAIPGGRNDRVAAAKARNGV